METLNFDASDVREMTWHLSALMTKVPLHAIANERQYDIAVSVLNGLLDAGGADENHALAPLVDIIGGLIGDYEDANHDLPGATPAAVLRELMNQSELRQGDLADIIGSQGVVSEILSGKRELNARQIALLSKRFHVSPAVFFAEVAEAV
ncbi:helix-turn-helix domain-containing protein [Cupriavidus pampae]|uniref:HTH cro/C1-type domain-containing protein n=1 Tax=Cupriavidus pampae TaxID=659251 RepID=A0ABM8Y2C3_9BURK|nr:helix-turn-helix domain-containing protein [Cupriavidus pampae]CAG9186899.1 hypothetical protein LMG32289_06684 [Cupriavidus pampae]